jgi:mannan endo-1,6-alpha-mannosidase
VAGNLLSYYHGTEKGETTGLLPGPPPAGDYYWWESGVMWDTLITYWDHTGDDQYNDLIIQALLWQTGPNNDYMPPNQTAALGNDDQGYWAMAAMKAAENGLSNNGAGKGQGWTQLVENVFASQTARWDEKTCGGGLRWQIASSNAGYDYKNSASNGVLFNIASRLAKETGNSTYADWADKTWEWMESVGFIDQDYNIFDGAHTETNCSNISKLQVSANAGIFLQGVSHMYNYVSAHASSKSVCCMLTWSTDQRCRRLEDSP